MESRSYTGITRTHIPTCTVCTSLFVSSRKAMAEEVVKEFAPRCSPLMTRPSRRYWSMGSHTRSTTPWNKTSGGHWKHSSLGENYILSNIWFGSAADQHLPHVRIEFCKLLNVNVKASNVRNMKKKCVKGEVVLRVLRLCWLALRPISTQVVWQVLPFWSRHNKCHPENASSLN